MDFQSVCSSHITGAVSYQIGTTYIRNIDRTVAWRLKTNFSHR